MVRLKDVRVPREHMFGKRQHVTRDGSYVAHTRVGPSKGADKLHYAVMMSARAGMVHGAGGKLALAATTAARYSCVRRQVRSCAARSRGAAHMRVRRVFCPVTPRSLFTLQSDK